MNILVGCERFGGLRDALRDAGHNAWSCDLAPTAGRYTEFHIQDDVLKHLARAPNGEPWDAGVFFPDCTYLTSSAAWAFTDGPYHQKVKPGTLVGAARRAARVEAIAFALKLWDSGIPKVAVENPRGELSRHLGRPQVIQPHSFGDDASKATCLWLRNLPRLRPTGFAPPRRETLPLFGGDGSRPRWSNQTDSGQNKLSPGADRAMERARSYPGIISAMVQQWFGE